MQLTAVILDWAGTVVDHGSHAPVATLLEIFKNAGVPITTSEARQSMGIAKRAHIGEILALPRVTAAWEPRYGHTPEEADLDRLYADFLPKQLSCLADYSKVIEGVPEAVLHLRAQGLKIGSTTGYTRPMLDLLLDRARAEGFDPDCALCPEDVPGGGRPGPWMCYLNAVKLAAGPMWTMVKIGDTPSDMAEGINAGMWTIGITRTGNESGMNDDEWAKASQKTRAKALEYASRRLTQAGSHYLAESVADCLPRIAEIDGRVARGERP